MQPVDLSPVPPITLRLGADLDVFADVASAVHDTDLDDVREGRTAHDGLGTPLRFVDNGDWPIDLEVDHDAEPVPDDLREWLRQAFRTLGSARVGLLEIDIDSASLHELLREMLRLQTGLPQRSPLRRLIGILRRG